MVKQKLKADGTGFSADDGQVKILIRPDNVALISPSAEHLEALLPYRKYVLEGQPDDALDTFEHSSCTAFPGGLVPRFEDELTADGYHVTIDDRRR